MTNEQINVAIAEAINADPHWKCAKDYCTDLNAMHEAERVLDYEQAELFGDTLYEMCEKENSELENPFPWRFARAHATARQRAEAFLRTLGKWEEVQR